MEKSRNAEWEGARDLPGWYLPSFNTSRAPGAKPWLLLPRSRHSHFPDRQQRSPQSHREMEMGLFPPGAEPRARSACGRSRAELQAPQEPLPVNVDAAVISTGKWTRSRYSCRSVCARGTPWLPQQVPGGSKAIPARAGPWRASFQTALVQESSKPQASP